MEKMIQEMGKEKLILISFTFLLCYFSRLEEGEGDTASRREG